MGFNVLNMSGGGSGGAGMPVGPLSGGIISVGEPMTAEEYWKTGGHPTNPSDDIKSHLAVLEQKLQEANERITLLEQDAVPIVEIMRRLEDLELELKMKGVS